VEWGSGGDLTPLRWKGEWFAASAGGWSSIR